MLHMQSGYKSNTLSLKWLFQKEKFKDIKAVFNSFKSKEKQRPK